MSRQPSPHAPSPDSQSFVDRVASWGLSPVAPDNARAHRIEQTWRWPIMAVLVCTIPAFYAELLQDRPSQLADMAYLVAAMVVGTALTHVSWYTRRPLAHLLANPTDVVLVLGLLAAAFIPGSRSSTLALGLRLLVAFLTLLRMVWSQQHLVTRGGVTYLLTVSLGVLLACGLGFWWLEPTTPTLADGMWLAFTTAATVGYGDVVPTTAASKIFSVFVVLLGFGVLTLVTAAIATKWVETEERLIEREIIHDMRHEMTLLRRELTALRAEVTRCREAAPPAVSPGSQGETVGLDLQQPVENE